MMSASSWYPRQTMKGLLWVGLVAAVIPVRAQDLPPLGANIHGGVFIPSDTVLRDVFGDSWFNWGISPGVIKTINGMKIDWDFAITSKGSGDNKIAILRPTFGVTLGLGVGPVAPYAAARTGLAYVDYAFDIPGGRLSGKRLVPTTNIEVGIMFGGRLGISARYDWVQSIQGVGYSGFSLQAVYQVLRF